MIPLLMQKGYRANGWLGLILGTRLYYSFYDAELDDDAVFEQRVEGLAREIGGRGMRRVPESVPPASVRAPALATGPAPAPAPAPAPRAPAPAPAPAQARALAPAPAPAAPAAALLAPAQSFTPTMQTNADALPLVERLLEQLVERDEAARQEARAEKAAMRAELDKLQAQLTAPREAVSARQVEEVTARVEALHAAQLLSDEELFAVEDCIADFVEARAAYDVVTAEIVHANAAVMGKLHKLVALSEGLAHDSMFARQLKRKFV